MTKNQELFFSSPDLQTWLALSVGVPGSEKCPTCTSIAAAELLVSGSDISNAYTMKIDVHQSQESAPNMERKANVGYMYYIYLCMQCVSCRMFNMGSHRRNDTMKA